MSDAVPGRDPIAEFQQLFARYDNDARKFKLDQFAQRQPKVGVIRDKHNESVFRGFFRRVRNE